MKTLDCNQIKEYLPHRYPLLLVDRVLDWESGKTIRAIKNVTINEEFFNGHFPNKPVMPGVLMIEALAQTSALLAFLTMGQKPDENAVVYFLGIDNVVALRGDALKTETYFHPEKDGNEYATDLVLQISNLNNGIYLDEDLKNSAQTNFCIGVAGYPEKHMEAPSLDSDIHFLKQKIKNGAKYIITQMFFDNKKYFDYVDKCRAAGITVPIIPGLKPIATKKQLNLIPHRFSLELPDDLIMAVVKAKDNDAVKQIGIEWCTQQSKELVAAGIPVLHYYSMGKAENIKAIAKEIF
jgi:beta-hydroxyacyl-ACP dehydratase FabZ